jgi:hypothetical protein
MLNKNIQMLYLTGGTVENKLRLTKRAADKWESARFQAVFNASAESRFQALTASRPLAANANRWAA